MQETLDKIASKYVLPQSISLFKTEIMNMVYTLSGNNHELLNKTREVSFTSSTENDSPEAAQESE